MPFGEKVKNYANVVKNLLPKNNNNIIGRRKFETYDALGANSCWNQLRTVLETNVESDVDAKTANNGQDGRQNSLIYKSSIKLRPASWSTVTIDDGLTTGHGQSGEAENGRAQ